MMNIKAHRLSSSGHLDGCAVNRDTLVGRAITAGRRRHITRAGIVGTGDVVLVAGATGGVGQLTTAKLLERGFTVRALVRSKAKALELFSNHPNLQVAEADAREASSLARVMDGIDAVACCTGTTAFPSKRWHGGNGPRPTDFVATTNIIAVTPRAVKRFVLVTSVGVERQEQFPWAILNLFGVLKYKRDAELALEGSGLPWTIVRPSRLTDGPYTSYDLNTLLQATSGSRQDVVLSPNDDQAGEASRIAVAEAVVQSLMVPSAENQAFALSSVAGEGPGTDRNKWEALFSSCLDTSRLPASALSK